MIDIPPRLKHDWYVYARPSEKRCFVVSSDGTTVNRLRNGSILHHFESFDFHILTHFPSSLPNGSAKIRGDNSESYCILDCIFHEHDRTYYVIDMVCWRGYSLYDCTAEFRFFWLNSKLAEETGACNPPSMYHKYKFSVVPIYECHQMGLQTAYLGTVPYVKDGLSFYNKHAHYHTGNTQLALVWKDENCSHYVIDTDSKGHTPPHQQLVLVVNEDGSLTTSDDPSIVFGCLSHKFSHLKPGNYLRFTVGDGGMSFVDGKLDNADLHYTNQAYRARASTDSYSKILFQYTARHSSLRIEDLVASLGSSEDLAEEAKDVEMIG
ncbi:hypothetical protein MKX01_006647 [Papaver californicum]|nr:hypothetical protein MKX01_006647 [Papaver californicum]